MKTNKILISVIVAFIFLLIMMPQCFAGDQELQSLDFDITLNDKGDMTIVETWDVEVYDTNTLYKTFPYNKSQGGNFSFSNVSVRDMTKGDGVEMTNVGRWMYHVDKGGYYATNNDEGIFEIGWSADSENKTSRKKYKIRYTVNNIVSVYNDCSELYWQLVGKAFEIPAENVTGTIHLPMAVSDLEDLRIWAHGPLTGEIDKKDNKTVVFKLPDLYTSEFLEIRVVTPNNIYEQATNKYNTNKLESIIAEETAWAEEANNKRIQAQKMAETVKYVAIASIVVSAAFFISQGLKSKRELEDRPEKQIQKLDYFRDFPAENATPGEAEFMRTSSAFNTQNVFSGIFMDLALKKCIDIEPIAGETKNVNIRVLECNVDLKKDEAAVYDFIQRAAQGKKNSVFDKSDDADFADKSVISMKQFRKYCEAHETASYNLWTGLKDKAVDECRRRGSYDEAIKNEGSKVGGRIAIAGLAIVGFGFVAMMLEQWLFILAIIPVFYAIAQHSKLSASYVGYTLQGWEEHERWNGLKKYMEDFSLLKEREIPELALWEKFMVYATAFGIAEKVLKQLKVAYPQLTDEYMMQHYRTMYYMNSFNVGREFGSSMSRGYQSYASSRMSSGSGGGGGFSGGGGGGFGGGGGGGR